MSKKRKTPQMRKKERPKIPRSKKAMVKAILDTPQSFVFTSEGFLYDEEDFLVDGEFSQPEVMRALASNVFRPPVFKAAEAIVQQKAVARRKEEEDLNDLVEELTSEEEVAEEESQPAESDSEDIKESVEDLRKRLRELEGDE